MSSSEINLNELNKLKMEMMTQSSTQCKSNQKSQFVARNKRIINK